MMPHRPSVLGVEITPGTHSSVLQIIWQHLVSGEGLLHVVTANPEYVMTARNDPAFADAINTAGVVTVDGAGLAIAMRLLHPQITTERYTGVMLTPDMANLSAKTGARFFLLGSGSGIADDAARVLVEKFPEAVIADTWAEGSPRPEHDSETMRRIRESGAGIVLVAYGAPAQIHWIQRNSVELEQAGVRIVAGIGGALDYISGHTPWAPPLVRRLGLEWLYRLVREPWRWRRQLVLPQFVVLVLIEAVRTKLRRGVE